MRSNRWSVLGVGSASHRIDRLETELRKIARYTWSPHDTKSSIVLAPCLPFPWGQVFGEGTIA